MRTTQRKGDLAVAKAILKFTKLNYDVSLPITESAPYDIVVDYNGMLKKVQVRFSSSKDVELRRIHSNSQGYVIKKTKDSSYDWLYVLSNSDKEYLFLECLSNRRSVRLSEKHLLDNTLQNI